eukprot:scaffold4229_cov38-Cyclotella_meneghiniana.AAC.3
MARPMAYGLWRMEAEDGGSLTTAHSSAITFITKAQSYTVPKDERPLQSITHHCKPMTPSRSC